jgi:CHAT domain-containing protein
LLVPLLVALTSSAPAAARFQSATAQPAPIPATATDAYREARATVDRGETAAAGKIVTAALARFRSPADDAVWALSVLRGELLINSNADEALAILASPLPARLSQSEIEVFRLYDLAVTYKRKGEEAHAHRTIDQAYELARTRQPRMLPRVLMGRSGMSGPKRDLVQLREALRLAQSNGDSFMVLKIGGMLGLFEAQAEHFDRAIAAWSSVIQQASASGSVGNTIEKTQGNLGWAYTELGNYELAAELFQAAEAGARKLSEDRDRVPWLNQLAFLRYRQHDWAGAATYAQQSYDLALKFRPEDAGDAMSLLARVRLATGELELAQTLAAKARALKQNLKKPRDDDSSTVLEAQIATARGDFATGEKKLAQVLAGKPNPSILWEAHGSLAQLYVRSGRRELAAEHYAEAVRTVQKARRDLPGADALNIRTTELRLSFYNQVDELFASYVDFLIADGKPEQALAVTEQSRAQTLEEGVGLAAAKGPFDPRTASRRAGAPVLCYWLARERSYLWVVTPTSVRVVTLPGESAIKEEVDRFQSAVRGTLDPMQSKRESGQKLYSMLVEPARLHLKPGGRVVAIPAGRLSAFNLETLIVPAPVPHYWLEDVTLTTASSLRLLAHAETLRPLPGGSMLLVGNPGQVDPHFPQLESAESEMKNVARHFRKPRLLDRADANPRNYRNAAPGRFDFVHFVAHGVAGGALPLESAIILDRSKDADGSYKLYARDIVGQPLQARLVTISSCHGAGTRAFTGEGLVGLAWAFLRAGSRQVIAALWEVIDTATPELMDELYDGISRGHDAATALRDAKLKMLHSGKRTRLPRYWAPFVLYEGS